MVKNEESQLCKAHSKKLHNVLKLQVVQEIEQGRISTCEACLKYGIQSRSTIVGWLPKFGNFGNYTKYIIMPTNLVGASAIIKTLPIDEIYIRPNKCGIKILSSGISESPERHFQWFRKR